METTRVVELHRDMSDLVLKAADTIDGFFGSERHMTFKQNTSNVRLRLNFDWIDTTGLELFPNFRIHLVLPGTLERLRIVANEEDDEGSDAGGIDAEDESNVALRFVGYDTDRRGVSFDVGARARSWELAGFGRINLHFAYPLGTEWIGRSTNRLYWYTDTGLRNDFRQYFEYQLTQKLFFRSRTRLQFFEEESDNPYPEQKITLFQQVGGSLVLAYEALAEIIPGADSPFDEEDIANPGSSYTHYELRVRSRFRTRWPWLFFEVWPRLLWPEERDFSSTPGASFRIEITFGHFGDRSVSVEE